MSDVKIKKGDPTFTEVFRIEEFAFFQFQGTNKYLAEDTTAKKVVADVLVRNDLSMSASLNGKMIFEAIAKKQSVGSGDSYNERTICETGGKTVLCDQLDYYVMKVRRAIRAFYEDYKQKKIKHAAKLDIFISVGYQSDEVVNYSRQWRKFVPKTVSILVDTFTVNSYDILKAHLQLLAEKRDEVTRQIARNFISEIGLQLTPLTPPAMAGAFDDAIKAMIDGEDEFQNRILGENFQLAFKWEGVEQDA